MIISATGMASKQKIDRDALVEPMIRKNVFTVQMPGFAPLRPRAHVLTCLFACLLAYLLAPLHAKTPVCVSAGLLACLLFRLLERLSVCLNACLSVGPLPCLLGCLPSCFTLAIIMTREMTALRRGINTSPTHTRSLSHGLSRFS